MFAKSPKFKLALIPALAALLGMVLMQDTSNLPISPETETTSQEMLVTTKKKVEWPQYDWEEIVLLQPFPRLKELEESTSADELSGNVAAIPEAEQEIPPVDPLKVRAVFQTPSGSSALLGDRVIRVGDVLPNGKRVTAIHPDGIEVAKD
jgi:hypothetical protein